MERPERKIICDDAINWLRSFTVEENSSFVASLPDISEFPSYSLDQWKNWFIETSKLILSKTSPESVTIFYQSDIKVEGIWVDKAFLCQKAAEITNDQLLWHKIICRAPAGTTTFGRPAYSHLLCFSKNMRVRTDKSTPDVLGSMGDKAWERGMGLEACMLSAKFIKEETTSKKIINPFCGLGSMLAAANFYELEAVGIERSPKRAERAQNLSIVKKDKAYFFDQPS